MQALRRHTLGVTGSAIEVGRLLNSDSLRTAVLVRPAGVVALLFARITADVVGRGLLGLDSVQSEPMSVRG